MGFVFLKLKINVGDNEEYYGDDICCNGSIEFGGCYWGLYFFEFCRDNWDKVKIR